VLHLGFDPTYVAALQGRRAPLAAFCNEVKGIVSRRRASVMQTVDVTLDLDQAPAPKVEILADVEGLQPIRWPVVLADRAFGSLDQLCSALGSELNGTEGK